MKAFWLMSAVLILGGCSALERVAAYEKETLATQKMLTEPDSVQSAFEAHLFPIREGTSGALGGFAGGCGCK